MATNRFSDPALNPVPPSSSHTGFPLLDLYLNTPAEFHREGDHIVEIHRDPTSHAVITEDWRNKNGQLDRTDGPASITRDPKTGIVCTEEWWKDGNPHRMGGPAALNRDAKTGIVAYEGWFVDGKLSRDNGPAWIVRDQRNGSIIVQSWAKDGVPFDDPTQNLWTVLRPSRPGRDTSAQGDEPAP